MAQLTLTPFIGIYDIGGDDLATTAEKLIHLLKKSGVTIDEARRCISSKQAFILLICGEAELTFYPKDESGYFILKGLADLDWDGVDEGMIEVGLLPLEIMDDYFCELYDYYD